MSKDDVSLESHWWLENFPLYDDDYVSSFAWFERKLRFANLTTLMEKFWKGILLLLLFFCSFKKLLFLVFCLWLTDPYFLSSLSSGLLTCTDYARNISREKWFRWFDYVIWNSFQQKHEVLEEETILVRCKWYSPREMADS